MPWLALALIPAVWLAAVFQTTVAPAMAIRQVSPDGLALLASVMLLLLPADRRALWLAAGVGFVADLISPGPLGAATLAFFLAAFVVGMLQSKLASQGVAVRLLFTAGFSSLAAMGISLAYSLAGEASLGFGPMLGRVLGVGLYTSALSYPFYLVLSWWPAPHFAPSSS